MCRTVTDFESAREERPGGGRLSNKIRPGITALDFYRGLYFEPRDVQRWKASVSVVATARPPITEGHRSPEHLERDRQHAEDGRGRREKDGTKPVVCGVDHRAPTMLSGGNVALNLLHEDHRIPDDHVDQRSVPLSGVILADDIQGAVCPRPVPNQ
jgi:hypothetical protein